MSAAEEQQIVEAKRALRVENLAAAKKRIDEASIPGLDASVKKNSTFTKKLKDITDKQRDALVKELKQLKLSKYIAEAVVCISENKFKTAADIDAAVHLSSLLHQRYAEFTTTLLPTLQKIFVFPKQEKEEEKTSRLVRQRMMLRFLTELVLLGIYPDLNIVYQHLRDIIQSEKDSLVVLTLIASYSRKYSEELTGIEPRNVGGNERSKPYFTESDGVVSASMKTSFSTLLKSYYADASKRLLQEHKKLRKLEKKNHEIQLNRGDLSDDEKQEYEKVLKAHEKFISNVQILSDCLQEDMPELPEEESTTRLGFSITVAEKKSSSGDDLKEGALWENEDIRTFYEQLLDLKLSFPPGFFEDKKGKGKETKEDGAKPAADKPQEDKDKDQMTEAELEALEKEMEKDEDKAPKIEEEDPEDSTGPPPEFDSVLARLSNCVNRELVDSIALDFCYLNAKNTRKRLVKALMSLSQSPQGLDLIPYFSRFVATLNKVIPEIGALLVDALQGEFKGKQRKKEAVGMESKVKNIRFVGELTKFKAFPANYTLINLKNLLVDFSPFNVELSCTLLECCGRFLFRSLPTHERTSNLLEIMMRKKNVLHLDNRLAMLVENAYYASNPPEKSAAVVKLRDPVEEYVRKMLYADLNRKTIEDIIKRFRKLNWKDPKTFQFILTRFIKVWKIKFVNIHHMANVASGLMRYHEDFAVALVDGLLEEIRVGLEENDPRRNQRRVAVVKYLGELYNYRVIESPTVFDTLYFLISFGHENMKPDPEVPSAYDSPTDFFRVRLVCTLLDTSGQFYDRGSLKTKLDVFLVYFQRYLLSKGPLSHDADFTIQDTMELLRPKLAFMKTYEEANKAVEKIEEEALQQVKLITDDAEERREPGNNDSGSSGEETDSDTESDSDDEDDEEAIEPPQEQDEEVIFVKKQEEAVVDEDFDVEFSKMMGESFQEAQKREGIKGQAMDVGIPMHLLGGPDKRAPPKEDQSKVTFSLLLKRGNKQQIKAFEVPADAPIAANRKIRENEVREEQQQLKKLVLNYEQTAGEEEAALEKMQIKAALMGMPVRQTNPNPGPSSSTGSNNAGNNPSGGGSSNNSGGGSGGGQGGGGRQGGGGQGGQGNKKYYTPTSVFDKRR